MSIKSEVRNAFKSQGLSPKKWMGQNLLVDERYLNKIVKAASIEHNETIVEIGAGLGVLTEALARHGAKVYALEVDAGFFRALKERLGASPNIELVHVDAMKLDYRKLANKLGKLRVVANLPYNISSRLIFLFCENRDIFSSLTILLQKEVAERFVADSGSKDYGVLTVLLGVHAEVDLLFDIPGNAFYPKPVVTSTLVRIVFPDPPPIPVKDSRVLTQLVKMSFAGRRKTLWNNLRNSRIQGLSADDISKLAEEAGIDLSLRAESIPPADFARFADVLAG